MAPSLRFPHQDLYTPLSSHIRARARARTNTHTHIYIYIYILTKEPWKFHVIKCSNSAECVWAEMSHVTHATHVYRPMYLYHHGYRQKEALSRNRGSTLKWIPKTALSDNMLVSVLRIPFWFQPQCSFWILKSSSFSLILWSDFIRIFNAFLS